MRGPCVPRRPSPPHTPLPARALRVARSPCHFLARHLSAVPISHGPPRSLFSFLLSLQRQVEVNVRNKILYLIQAWAHAFRNEPKYKVVQDTYQIMKVEGELGGVCQVPGSGHSL